MPLVCFEKIRYDQISKDFEEDVKEVADLSKFGIDIKEGEDMYQTLWNHLQNENFKNSNKLTLFDPNSIATAPGKLRLNGYSDLIKRKVISLTHMRSLSRTISVLKRDNSLKKSANNKIRKNSQADSEKLSSPDRFGSPHKAASFANTTKRKSKIGSRTLDEHSDEVEEVSADVQQSLENTDQSPMRSASLKNITRFGEVRETENLEVNNKEEKSEKKVEGSKKSYTPEEAAFKIQVKYMGWRNLKQFREMVKKNQEPENKESKSLILSHSIQETACSAYSELYRKVMMDEEELRRESSSDKLFLKVIEKIKFDNTPLRAKAYVYRNMKKPDPKDWTIDVEIMIPMIGLYHLEKISESNITQNVSVPFEFVKRIDELLTSKLEYDPKRRVVEFKKEGRRPPEPHKKQWTRSHTPEHAKFELIRYCQRVRRTRFMCLIEMRKTKINNITFNISFYWHDQSKQIYISVEQIKPLKLHKEIWIQLEHLTNNPRLKAIIDSPELIKISDKMKPKVKNGPKSHTSLDFKLKEHANFEKQLLEWFKPYTNFFAHSIVIEKVLYLNSSNTANLRQYKYSIDRNVMKIKSVNKRTIELTLLDVPFAIAPEPDVLINWNPRSHQQDLFDTDKFEANGQDQEESKLQYGKPYHDDQNTKIESENKALEGPQISKVNSSQPSSNNKSPINQNEQVLTAGSEFEKAATKIAKFYRGYSKRSTAKSIIEYWQELRRRKERVKQSHRLINKKYWTIDVSKRVHKESKTITYNFYATYTNLEKHGMKEVARGSITLNNTTLINLENQTMEDFLLDRITITNQSIGFRLDSSENQNLGI